MENIVRNVRDIDAGDRPALEHVVGQSLRDNQRLIIRIAEIDVLREEPTAGPFKSQALAEWTSVYEGLSDEQIDAIDAIINTRANLTRDLP